MKFPVEWKKVNVVPTHKKSDKQCIKNCLPASLLSICSKMFERLSFNELHKFLNKNNLLSSNQLGIWLGVFCINQLFPISQEINQSIDNDLKLSGVLLDITKVFDKFWYEGPILKFSRKKRALLNGQNSFSKGSIAGVPQESILVLDLYKRFVWWLVDQLWTICRWHVPFHCYSWCHYKFLWA